MRVLHACVSIVLRFLLLIVSRCAGRREVNESVSCNGRPEFCELGVDQFSFPGVHNGGAYRLRIDGVRNAATECATENHARDVLQELELGLRFFDIDTCKLPSDDGLVIRVCHGPATGRLLADEFREMRAWLEQPGHDGEVVVISLGDANPGEDTQESKNEMMELILAQAVPELGDLLLSGVDIRESEYVWPTLGALRIMQKRVVLLWGRRLWYSMVLADEADPSKQYGQTYLRFQRSFVSTWTSEIDGWKESDLDDYLVGFCEKPPEEPLVMADVYLSIGTSPPFCLQDLARQVNSVVLNDEQPEESALMRMQAACWERGKQVSLVSMDYAENFQRHLTVMAGLLNERNFARHGWVGGTLSVLPDFSIGAPAVSVPVNGTNITELAARELLSHWGGVDLMDGRISIDYIPLSSSAAGGQEACVIEFTIVAPLRRSLVDVSNSQVLLRIQAELEHQSSAYMQAQCGDPGVPDSGSRTERYAVPSTETPRLVVGSVLSFQCGEGKRILGSPTRTCGPDGLFTGIQPWCVDPYRPGLSDFWIILLHVLLVLCVCLGCCCLLCRWCRRRRRSDAVAPQASEPQKSSHEMLVDDVRTDDAQPPAHEGDELAPTPDRREGGGLARSAAAARQFVAQLRLSGRRSRASTADCQAVDIQATAAGGRVTVTDQPAIEFRARDSATHMP